MYAGKPVEIGPVDDIYYSPRMPYTLGLLGSLPRMDLRSQDRLTPIQGAPPSLLNLPPGCPFTPRCPIAAPVCETIEPELLQVSGPGEVAARLSAASPSPAGVPGMSPPATTPPAASVPDTSPPATISGSVHLAACHLSDQLLEREPGELFATTATDPTDLEKLL
jgi:oligopeptide/dipeptide ABC transporter ATP-binding protein